MLESIQSWLACADIPVSTNLIFVLAGQQSRKTYGLGLFRSGLAPQILLSTGRFEVRRFATLDLPQKIDLLKIVQDVPPQQRHFFVSFTSQKCHVQRIFIGPLGTLSEIEALKQWLKGQPQIASILMISSETHLRRLRICCRALLPRSIRVSFTAVQEENSTTNCHNWRRKGETRKLVLLEVCKIIFYSIVLPIHSVSLRRSSLHPPIIPGSTL
jgi:uncharacterized SAM-binding protein YcdF (DUF218 family)